MNKPKPKHTPWKLASCGRDAPRLTQVKTAEGITVADCISEGVAQLLVAAPELLETLIRAERIVAGDDAYAGPPELHSPPHSPERCTLCAIRAAIAKAGGRP